MQSTNELIAELEQSLVTQLMGDHRGNGAIWVGYSGGVDSHLLLALVKRVCPSHRTLRAIHVNHQLNPAADDWQAHCVKQAAQLEVECLPIKVSLAPTGSGLEARARKARYGAMSQQLAANDVLILGHHLDDQMETVLFRLLRGSGPVGLAGMRVTRAFGDAKIVRPWLHYTRSQILQAAQALELHWIEDDSNDNLRFDRNFLRHEILPKLRSRWPSIAMTLGQTAQHCADAAEILRDCARTDLQTCMIIDDAFDDQQSALSCVHLKGMSGARRANLLRYWLELQTQRVPNQQVVAEIERMLSEARSDRNPVIDWENFHIKRYNQRLYLQSRDHARDAREQLMVEQEVSWHPLEQPILRWCGQSFEAKLTTAAFSGEGLDLSLLTFPLLITRRRGGERLRPFGDQHTRPLKKLFQVAKVPPWQRERMPIFYSDEGGLVQAGDRWLASKYVANLGSQALIIRSLSHD